MDEVTTTARRTDDPEVAVAVIEHTGRSRVTGAPHRFPALAALRVRHGEIVSVDPLCGSYVLGKAAVRTHALPGEQRERRPPSIRTSMTMFFRWGLLHSGSSRPRRHSQPSRSAVLGKAHADEAHDGFHRPPVVPGAPGARLHHTGAWGEEHPLTPARSRSISPAKQTA